MNTGRVWHFIAPALACGVTLTSTTLSAQDGIDFLGSNCDCPPPDTNAAAANDFVVQAVDTQII